MRHEPCGFELLDNTHILMMKANKNSFLRLSEECLHDQHAT